METEIINLNLKKKHKTALINRKLSDLFQKFESRTLVLSEFMIWFGEMEKQNWNGGHIKRKA